MAPCRVFKYYKNIYCSKNLAENPEKFWVEYSNRLVGLGQVASLTKSGQEPIPCHQASEFTPLAAPHITFSLTRRRDLLSITMISVTPSSARHR